MHVHYRPANDVLEYLQEVNFVAVVGPTAVGKNSVVEEAVHQSPDIRWTPFTTSRLPRTGEKQGVEYQFRPRQEMEERIQRQEYVNVAPNLLGDLYASAPEDFKQHGINTAAVLADVVPTFRALPFKILQVIFILPPNWEAWQQRLRTRNFSPEQADKRMQEAQRSLYFALNDQNTLFIINDDLSQAARDFSNLVHSGSAPDATNQFRATNVARDLLGRLDKIVN